MKLAVCDDVKEDVLSSSTVSRIYNVAGVPIRSSQNGINIYRYSDGTTRKVVRSIGR